MLQALKKLPYKVDISILAAICLITVGEYALFVVLSYREGLRNFPGFGFLSVFLVCELLKIIVVLLAIIRGLIRGYFHTKRGRGRKSHVTTALLSLLLFAGGWILPMRLLPGGAFFFLQGPEKWVRQNVDIDSIQTWLLSEEADTYSGQSYRLDFPDELPSFLTDFDPKFIIFHEAESRKGKCIEFAWGGGLAYWGFVVGSPEMEAKQEGVIKHSESNYEFRRPIQPGVYVFDEG